MAGVADDIAAVVAVSGEAPHEPVVSAKSGHLFEKRLILKHLAERGTDPVSGEPLSEDDLVAVKSAPAFVRPRPPAATSIPTLLLTLQNEWDAVMLETHTLKQQHHAVRLELTTALYEVDAAKRVIGRLLKERDEARSQLAHFRVSAAQASGASASASSAAAVPDTAADVDMDVAVDELPADVVQHIDETASELSKIRRKRKAPPTLATPEEIAALTV
ncbi:Prp19/Pso4-like-domain-containing protein, partial [Entophlyctis helioformis]